jgi:hypothetical protein
MMLSHSAARRAAAAPSKARPAPARPALRPRRPLAAARAAGDVTGGAAGGGEDDRERLAHEVLRAESFEALPNDLKAAVAETAGGEQVGAHLLLTWLARMHLIARSRAVERPGTDAAALAAADSARRAACTGGCAVCALVAVSLGLTEGVLQ